MIPFVMLGLMMFPVFFSTFICCLEGVASISVATDQVKTEKYVKLGLKHYPLMMLIPVVVFGFLNIVVCVMTGKRNSDNKKFANIIADNLNNCSDSSISKETFIAESELIESNVEAIIIEILVLIVLDLFLFALQKYILPPEPETYGPPSKSAPEVEMADPEQEFVDQANLDKTPDQSYEIDGRS